VVAAESFDVDAEVVSDGVSGAAGVSEAGVASADDVDAPSTSGVAAGSDSAAGVSVEAGAAEGGAEASVDVSVTGSVGNESRAASSGDSITDRCGVPRT
jgi:hypothetical protein